MLFLDKTLENEELASVRGLSREIAAKTKNPLPGQRV
jgi:hypothetical protein